MAESRRFALVTGASSGIDAEFARIFAREGWGVVSVARSLEPRHSARPGPPGSGASALRHGRKRGHRLEALVNSAGFATYGQFKDLPLEDERQEIQLNVATLTELTKLFLPPMLAAGRGRILNVASTAAFAPGPFMAVYYATKAYVLSFSEALSNELEGTGVTVTALCPGPTASGFQARAQMEESMRVKGRKLPTAASVAEAGYRAMMAGLRLEIPGTMNRIIALLRRLQPRGLVLKASRRMTRA